jgi:hypothetical protein
VRQELDDIWIACARTLELPVQRGGDAYVHFDGRTLWIADDSHLDDDDTVAQLVLHELCHWAVQGEQSRAIADWGLDNTTDRDAERERAAVRLQAHLCGAYGLRGLLFPTTVVRPFFESLPARALGEPDDSDPSVALARQAATRVGRWPMSPAIPEALERTATLAGVPRHPHSKHPLVDDLRTCGTCAWRTVGAQCRQSDSRRKISADARACVRHEDSLDCLTCGACCRSAYDAVWVGARDLVRKRHPELIATDAHGASIRRSGDRCAALDGPPAGPYHCRIYDDRPRTCRDFTLGGRHCLTARRRVGLSL